MNTRTQVLIVGAGPTGLTLAAELARLGIDFVLFDKKKGITKLSKALAVHARSLEVFEDCALADKAIERGQLAQGADIIVNGRRRGFLNLKGIGRGLTEYAYLLVLEQSETEKLLLEYLKKKKKKVHWKHELVSLRQNKNKTIAKLKSGDKKYEIEADYVVGCDGASSTVRKSLKMDFKGSTTEELFYVVDAQVDWELKGKERLRVFFSREKFVLYFPMKGGKRHRIVSKLDGFDMDTDPKDIPYETIEEDILKDTSVPVRIFDVDWYSAYKVHSRKAKSFRKGRIFLAGDAAHIHTPAGGQGMNTGIQDAYNLAWKLAYVLKGKMKESILDSYDDEREMTARTLLRGTDKVFEYMAGTRPIDIFLRLYVLPYVLSVITRFRFLSRGAFLKLSQINIHYEGVGIVESELDGIVAGKRLPYSRLKGASIYDSFRGDSFYLLHAKGVDLNLDLPEWVQPFELPKKSELGELLGVNYLLLRPDKHVAYVGGELAEISTYIQRFRTPCPE